MGPTAETLLDSLPYYDRDLELHPNLRALVDTEIDRELKRNSPPANELHPRVPKAIQLFESNPILAAELKRVASREPLQALDTARYQIPAPTSPNPTEEEWKAALNNAKAQIEHQLTRQVNLGLLQQYGANAWKVRNYVLEASVVELEKAVEELKERVTEVNRNRKNAQTHVGKQLTSLETRWTELVSSILQIELANLSLESEVEQLRLRELSLES